MRQKRPRGCTYAVAVDADATAAEVTALASYLSTLGPADCEVLILDTSIVSRFEANRRVLCWVGHHVSVSPRHLLPDGEVDLVRAALDLASCEKVIIASHETRCTAEDIRAICALLDKHEVVEPEEYVAAKSWWGGIEAGRILLHRGVEQPGQNRSTVAVRRSAYRPLLEFESGSGEGHLRRLISHGAAACDSQPLFVRREPPQLDRWLRGRARDAAADFSLPLKTAFFVGFMPVIILLAIIGGTQTAGGYAGVVAFASVLLALKGRTGASRFFPLHAVLFAPLWVVERSVSVYWALIAKLRGTNGDRQTANGKRQTSPAIASRA